MMPARDTIPSKAFMRIKEIRVRRRIVGLVEEIAGDDSN